MFGELNLICFTLYSNWRELFWTVSVNGAWSVHISLLIQTRWLVVLWVEDTYFNQKQNILMMNLFITNDMQLFAKLLWCFYQLFRLSLTEPIDFRWSIGEQVMECYMFSKPVSTSSTSWMAWGWVHFQLIFIFGWAIPWMLICKWIVHLCS